LKDKLRKLEEENLALREENAKVIASAMKFEIDLAEANLKFEL